MQGATLTEGNISKSLIKMTIPMFFGMIGFALFNLVDNKFVAELGVKPLAAVSFTVITMLIMFALAFGLGTGVTATVSKAIGENDEKKVKRLTTDGILLAIFLGVLLTAVGYPTIKPLFNALGATDDLMPYIYDYMKLWYLGIPLIIIPMVGNSAIRAQGNTLIPATIMGVSIVANIFLDYGFILGNWGMPRWEVFGASFATFLSRMLTLISALGFLHFKFKMLSFKGYSFKGMLRSWYQILRIGFPSILTQLVIPISVALVTKLASSFEHKDQLVSALQISARVDFFAIALIASLGTVLVPFIGQNLGAKNFGRIKEAIKISRRFTIVYGIVMTVLFILIREEIGPVFSKENEPDMIFLQYMSEFYWLIPFTFVFRMFFALESSAINAIQKPVFTGVLTFGEMIIVYVPLAYALSDSFGYIGIIYAFITATVLGGFGAFWVNNKLLKIVSKG